MAALGLQGCPAVAKNARIRDPRGSRGAPLRGESDARIADEMSSPFPVEGLPFHLSLVGVDVDFVLRPLAWV